MPRYLGQHFLKNKAKLRKIVDALDLKDSDVVIEIGPGRGALTDEIVLKFKSLKVEKFKIIAIEKDKNLVEFLREKYKCNKNIEIIEGDALKILPKLTNNSITNNLITKYKVVGNIPYYITGYLFRVLSELEIKPELIVLLIQKEVAERIIAQQPKMNPPHRRAMWGMNLLSASVQFWAEPKIIGNVSRKYFNPPPKVDSAIIRLKSKKDLFNITLCSRLTSKCNMEKHMEKYVKGYYKFIKILFKQPRKTIVNNIESGIKKYKARVGKEEIIEKLKKLCIAPNARPQDLSIEQIIELLTLI